MVFSLQGQFLNLCELISAVIVSPPSPQLMWTALSTISHVHLTDATVSQEVVVSYLPLSHIAAQMVDMWITMRVGGLTHFAQPDALKVRSKVKSQQGHTNPHKLTRLGLCSILSGLPGKHHEGGASHGLHGCPAGLGEDAGEDEGRRRQVFGRAQEGGLLGQRCGPA